MKFDNEVIQQIVSNTKTYETKYDKSIRRDNCQYFTPYDIAKYMCEMFDVFDKVSLKVLDPCGGTGVLELCIIEYLLKRAKLRYLLIDIYEKDINVIDTLEKNIEIIKNSIRDSNLKLQINIINENYILKNNDFWNKQKNGDYDLVIGNPPYKKIGKDSEEANVMSNIVFGQPNIYMLFLAMSVLHMKDTGQLVYLIPRSFCNGKYFKEFRKWLKDNCYLSCIHSFYDRSKIFNDEVLQELIILKIEKFQKKEIVISHSQNSLDLKYSQIEMVESDFIWESSELLRIRLPLHSGDNSVLNIFEKFTCTMEGVGIVFSTGPVVDFRVKSGLSESEFANSVPVIWSAHFGKNEIDWPNKKKEKLQQYIALKGNENILVDRNDYLLIKRFFSKEENGIKINILWKEKFSYSKIGIENHVNYAKLDDNKLLLAIFVLFKSRIYNRYFKIINGTTQVNVSDLNILPVPPLQDLKLIGGKIDKRKLSEISSDDCDKIIHEYLRNL